MNRQKQKKMSRLKRNQRPAKQKGVNLTFDGQHPPAHWPLVSLCMIVKNEAHNLAACLESVGDLAGEIIIVDTGSIDRTVEIARAWGAKVKHFAWINDFAAARNESIREARGDWIFWMDADDRLSPQNLSQLKQALVSGRADAYLCRVVSQREQTKTAVEHLRLFRNHLGLQFERPLHETVLPAVVRQGLNWATTNIVIDHTGYEIDGPGLKAKARRNLTIIQRCLAQEPHNLHWLYHRGACLAVLEEYPQAIEAYEAVIAHPPESLNWDFDIYQAHLSLLEAYIKTGQWEEAEQTVRRAFQRFPQRRHLAITAGIFFGLRDQPEKAARALERAATLSPETDRVGHAWPPGKQEAELGYAYVLLGRLSPAKTAYRAMLKALALAEQAVAGETWRQAQTFFAAQQYLVLVDCLTPAAQGDPAALRLLAQAEQQQQHWGQAARCLAQAMALSEAKTGEWASLAGCLLKSGKTQSAERLCHLALAENGNDTEALHWLALIALQQNDIGRAMGCVVQLLLVDPAHAAALNTLEQIAGGLQLSTLETLREHGLRMIHQQKFVLAGEAFALLTSLAPADVEAYKSLAVAWQRSGQQEAALLAWQAAQQLATVKVT